MSGPHEPDQEKEPPALDRSSELADVPVTLVTTEPGALTPISDKPDHPNAEWIPGEQLELIRIPPPTIWPATLALGATGIAFGVVTHWILSLAGLFLFLLGAAGWIEDLRKDVL